jgi:hypothetical protein
LWPSSLSLHFGLSVYVEGWVKNTFNYQLPNLAFLLAITFIPFLGIQLLDYLLKRWGPIERLKDKHGRPVEIPARHSFMFLPLSWCAYSWVVLMALFHLWALLYPRTSALEIPG